MQWLIFVFNKCTYRIPLSNLTLQPSMYIPDGGVRRARHHWHSNEITESPVHFSPASTAIVVEDNLVISSIPTFADAFALFFGLMYALHLDYPKKLTHTFTFIQKILMGLDDGKPLKPCILSLKNDLLFKE